MPALVSDLLGEGHVRNKTLGLVTPLVEREEDTASVPGCEVGSAISQDFTAAPFAGG